MALPKHLSFLRRGSGGQCLEIFLDPICPASARAYHSITDNVLPLIDAGGKYHGQMSLVTRIYPHPVHYLAGFHTEALLLFGKTYPEQFWDYFGQIFGLMSKHGAVEGNEFTGNQIRDQLTELAMEVAEKANSIDKSSRASKTKEFREKLVNIPPPSGRGPAENDVSKDLKYLVRVGRQNGIIVTLTGLFNGVRDDSISSSWGKDEWEKYLASKLP
ncbi:MAG: hypothetical protein TREMPRED_004717 [Tremellales sp. Tagirdzhanova-0007]|nr:MAG: hypothetical protein TREMPRED_004717 [Tremellales sp. Tagirdzhanova-0007]